MKAKKTRSTPAGRTRPLSAAESASIQPRPGVAAAPPKRKAAASSAQRKAPAKTRAAIQSKRPSKRSTTPERSVTAQPTPEPAVAARRIRSPKSTQKRGPEIVSAASSKTQLLVPPTPTPLLHAAPRQSAPAKTPAITQTPAALPAVPAAPTQPAPDPKLAEAKLGLKIPAVLFEGDRPPGPLLSGPGRKFAVGLGPARPAVEPEEGELPEAYGTGRLWLTARDPHCLCAHWDLTAAQQQQCTRLSAHQHLLVRLFRDAPAGRPLNEIHVHPESRHWFIHVDQAGIRYAAELGYYEHDHHWHRLAVADPVGTPVEAVAEPAPVQFATIIYEPVTSTEPAPPAPILVHRPAPSLPAQAASATFTTPFRSQTLATATVQTAPGFTPTEAAAAPWTPAQEHALAELIGWSTLRQEWFGSEQITEVIQGEHRRELPAGISSLAAAQLVPAQPSSITAVPEQAPSSPAGGEQPPGKSFWFNVNAELIIYGATEPDAQVTIGGRPIRLRLDGSFSYRFALPDGQYHLPIEATATHGDRRAARLRFYRGTEYSGEVGAHPQDAALKRPSVENVS